MLGTLQRFVNEVQFFFSNEDISPYILYWEGDKLKDKYGHNHFVDDKGTEVTVKCNVCGKIKKIGIGHDFRTKDDFVRSFAQGIICTPTIVHFKDPEHWMVASAIETYDPDECYNAEDYEVLEPEEYCGMCTKCCVGFRLLQSNRCKQHTNYSGISEYLLKSADLAMY